MSTKTITRTLINKDINLIICGYDEVYNYDQIINYIDRIKTYLIKEKHATAGQSIMLLHGNIHVPWLYACAELGMQLVIAMHHMFKQTKLEEINEIYGNVDFLVRPVNADFSIGYHYQDPIDINVIKNYNDTSCADVFYATPDTILTKSISETAKKIKIEYHTHGFFFDLLERNAKLFDIKSNDRCMHTKMLHHGPVFGEFFLPSIKYAKTHIWYTDDDQNTFNYLFEYKITRATFLYNRAEEFANFVFYTGAKFTEEQLIVLSNLNMHLIRSPIERTIALLVQKYGVSLTISFGSTATAGPLLLQKVDKNNANCYNQYEFVDPNDKFYTVSIVDGNLTVVMPDTTVITTTDKFEYYNEIYHFVKSL